MKNRFGVVLAAVAAAGFLAGCSTKVQRVDIDKTVDLSGRWNDTDARKVAEGMIKDALTRPWYAAFQGKNNRLPVVIVGSIRNESHEHINTEIFTKELERSLINSNHVKFVASRDERGEVREEREDQQVNSTAATRKQLKQETGADYMLIGSVGSVKDEVKGKYVIMYQTNLELIDLETNEKVWIGDERIKKLVSRPQYSL